MAPFLDFFNHSNTADVEAKLDLKRNAYILKTNKPFKKYEQIFIKYGAFSNLRLLVEYGFIIKEDDLQDAVDFNFQEVLAAAKLVNPIYGKIFNFKKFPTKGYYQNIVTKVDTVPDTSIIINYGHGQKVLLYLVFMLKPYFSL